MRCHKKLKNMCTREYWKVYTHYKRFNKKLKRWYPTFFTPISSTIPNLLIWNWHCHLTLCLVVWLSSVDALMKEVSTKSTKLQKYTCDVSCGTLLWDGFGRWVNGHWKPYIKGKVQWKIGISENDLQRRLEDALYWWFPFIISQRINNYFLTIIMRIKFKLHWNVMPGWTRDFKSASSHHFSLRSIFFFLSFFFLFFFADFLLDCLFPLSIFSWLK